jgi:hypothetical protein
VKHPGHPINNANIISRFKNEYWFDHNWSFGMHGQYLYTLTFHFDHFYEFYDGFDDRMSKTNNVYVKKK